MTSCTPPPPAAPAWELFPHVASALAEAAAASELWCRDRRTVLYGPGNRLVDTAGAGLTVDAKRSWLDDQGNIGFMGAGRDLEARPGVSHYGLTVSDGWVRVTSAPCGGLDLSGHVDSEIYLVPSAVINRCGRPYARMDGAPGHGRNRYLALRVVTPHRAP